MDIKSKWFWTLASCYLSGGFQGMSSSLRQPGPRASLRHMTPNSGAQGPRGVCVCVSWSGTVHWNRIVVAEACLRPCGHLTVLNIKLFSAVFFQSLLYMSVCARSTSSAWNLSSSGVNPNMNAACLARKKSDKVGSFLDQHVDQFWFAQRIKTIWRSMLKNKQTPKHFPNSLFCLKRKAQSILYLAFFAEVFSYCIIYIILPILLLWYWYNPRLQKCQMTKMDFMCVRTTWPVLLVPENNTSWLTILPSY